MLRKTKTVTISLMMISAGLLNNKANAQSDIHVFVHGLFELSVDKSTMKRYSSGLGAEAGIQYGRTNTFITGTMGYTDFFHKGDSLAELGDLSYIPIRLGIRQNLGRLLYVHGDAGVGFIKNTKVDNSDNRFSFDAGAGVNVNDFEVELAVDSFKELNPDGWSFWVGVKAGWRIDFFNY